MLRPGKMTQYQDAKDVNPQTPKPSERASTIDRKFDSLHERIRKQEDDTIALQRDIKRLRNELRVAVNTLNLKSNG